MTPSFPSISSRSQTSRCGSADAWLSVVTRSCAGLVASALFLVVGFLVRESIPALREIGIARFFSDPSWHPLSGQFRVVPMVLATAITSIGALLIAGPLGIASGIFVRFYAPRILSTWYQRLVELLAGIPSVVFGLWGLVVLAPIVGRWSGSGQNLLTATLVLAIMVLPTVALTSASALRSVSLDLITSGAALGLPRWSIAARIALPAARRGIQAGIMLALARALGETMAVLMLAGNVAEMPTSLVSPGRTLTANIALEMGYATSAHRSTLFVSGLVLLAAVTLLAILAEFTGGRRNAA